MLVVRTNESESEYYQNFTAFDDPNTLKGRVSPRFRNSFSWDHTWILPLSKMGSHVFLPYLVKVIRAGM